MKILIDMNLAPAWADYLVAEGFEAVHWVTVGDPTAPDRVLMAWAAERGFILFTHDLDFGMLLAATKSKSPSVIQMRFQDATPRAVGAEVVHVLRSRRSAIQAGALVTIDKLRDRVRILPFEKDTKDA